MKKLTIVLGMLILSSCKKTHPNHGWITEIRYNGYFDVYFIGDGIHTCTCEETFYSNKPDTLRLYQLVKLK